MVSALASGARGHRFDPARGEDYVPTGMTLDKCTVLPIRMLIGCPLCSEILGTGQLVPKSTRTLVNSYPFLVNSYHSQLVPKSTRTLVYL